jgi:splicing factor 3A subunit 1
VSLAIYPFATSVLTFPVEMLDPRWREQSRIAAQRSSTTNLSTADVANNLKRLASQRSDVFDPVTGQAVSDEEAQRRKRIELSSYDGVNTSQSAAPGAPGSQSTDVQEQVSAHPDQAW